VAEAEARAEAEEAAKAKVAAEEEAWNSSKTEHYLNKSDISKNAVSFPI